MVPLPTGEAFYRQWQQCLHLGIHTLIHVVGSPERHPNPRGRSVVPRPPHTTALGAPGEKKAQPQNSSSGGRRKVPCRVRVAWSLEKGGLVQHFFRRFLPGDCVLWPLIWFWACVEGFFFGVGALSFPPPGLTALILGQWLVRAPYLSICIFSFQ